MQNTEDNKGTWLMISVLTVILVVGIIIMQPMTEEEAIKHAKEFAPKEFSQVQYTEFFSAGESEELIDMWYIELGNDENDRAAIKINANNGKLIEGTIEDGETGETIEEF